jgi:hypothetical protein
VAVVALEAEEEVAEAVVVVDLIKVSFQNNHMLPVN